MAEHHAREQPEARLEPRQRHRPAPGQHEQEPVAHHRRPPRSGVRAEEGRQGQEWQDQHQRQHRRYVTKNCLTTVNVRCAASAPRACTRKDPNATSVIVTAVPEATMTLTAPEVSVAHPEDPVAAAGSALTCTSCTCVSVGAKIVTTSASSNQAMAFEDAYVVTPVIAETTRFGRFASAWLMAYSKALRTELGCVLPVGAHRIDRVTSRTGASPLPQDIVAVMTESASTTTPRGVASAPTRYVFVATAKAADKIVLPSSNTLMVPPLPPELQKAWTWKMVTCIPVATR